MQRLAKLAAVLAVAAITWVLAGCTSRDTVGLSDVDLELSPVDPEGRVTQAVALAVSARLSASHVTSDVEVASDHALRVTVDEALAPTVVEVLAWNGGIEAFEADPSFALTLTGPGVTRDGDSFTGRRAALVAALAREDLGADHRALFRSLGAGNYAVRVVRAPARFVIVPAKLDDRGEAGALSVTPVSAPKGLPEGGRYLFALDGTLVGEGPAPLPTSPLVIRFGHGWASYTVAHETKRLLASPPVSPMRRVSETRLPKNWPLFLACIVLPFAVSALWLWFVRRFDRAHPEPMRTIVITFVLGNLAVIPAGFAEKYLALATPYLDPPLSTMGGRLVALPLSVLVYTLVVGVVEEGVKLLASVYAFRRREFDEPVDGIVYAVTASLGFAAAENIRYFAMGRLAPSLVCARAFMTVPAHMIFGAIWGFAFGEVLTGRKPRRLRFFALAALSHGTFDALLSTDGGGAVATVLVLGLSSAFVVMLRRSLRFGIVGKDRATSGRRLFPMGNALFFGVAVALFHLTALVLFFLGAVLQYGRHHVSAVFVLVSAALLLAFGALMDMVARTLPLDAVTDARGVTFSGTTREWHDVLGARLVPGALILVTRAGELRIGPGRPEMLSALAHEIDAQLLQR